MLDAAGAVVQRIGFERKIGVADFDTAVLVGDAVGEIEGAGVSAQRPQCAGARVVEAGAVIDPVAQGTQLPRGVVQRAALQRERGVGFDQAAPVDQVGGGEVDAVAAELAAVGVRQRGAGRHERGSGEEFACIAGQRIHAQGQAVDQAGDHARFAAVAAGVQRTGGDLHGVALNRPADVADRAVAQLQPGGATTREQRTAVVIQRAAGVDQPAAACDQLALLAVAQGGGLQAQLIATNAAALIVELGRTADGDQTTARIDDAGQVAQQVADCQGHVAATADHCAIAVVDQARRVDPNALAKQRTGAVVQPCAADLQVTVTLDLTAAVEQLRLACRRGEAQGHALRSGGQQALLAVVETGGTQVDAVTDDPAATVIDLRARRADVDARSQHAAAAVIQTCGIETEVAGDRQ
ncbi:Unknown protein sequence [Pseudomonas syringae pv. cilantro]|uniref:Uncharacterized protein n=1 Tax=Pseudomonas syringae pv. cilantro TaxID=81035 RepID=A0A0N0X758_PSESX|nr:Unknown protein sequence [Pseudomonas syringae pv. cilantro]